ncbi:hypothetical protein [Nostoc sp.]|uniref:hypothetical protein n=1 Tax=Nostoc sp. TaxID=1180 RepID=UPI002FF9B231
MSCELANIVLFLGKSTYDTIAIATALHEDINKFSDLWCVLPTAITSNTENPADYLMIWLQSFFA